MGPGMNAGAERLLLAKDPAYAEVDFWDQPQATGTDAFTKIARAATERAEALARGHGGPIDLIAHSFGGHFAREIAENRPDLVRSIRLISTSHDVAGQFLRLMRTHAVDPETPAELAVEMQSLLRQISDDGRSRIWEIIGLITRDPSFMRLYWPKREQFDTFVNLTRTLPALHAETFASVVKEYLNNLSDMPTRMPWKGKAELVLGAIDPLISVDEAEKYWRRCFPRLEVEIRESSGHYPHLETPLAEFMK